MRFDGFLAHIKDNPDVMKIFAAAIAEALVAEQRSRTAHEKKRTSLTWSPQLDLKRNANSIYALSSAL